MTGSKFNCLFWMAVFGLMFSVPHMGLGQSKSVELDRHVSESLKYNARRMLSSDKNSAWQIVHGVLGIGEEFQIRDASQGTIVRAVDYLCQEARVENRRLFYVTPHGLEPIYGYGAEGHPDQILAIFAQVNLPLTQSIRVDGASYTVADLVSQSQARYRRGNEGSWTLIALASYLPLNSTWTNQYGQSLSIADLVAAEATTDPSTAPRGGTHNLYALAYALGHHKASGATLTGVWRQADAKLAEHVRLVREYQNGDGSYSVNYFSGPGWSQNTKTVLYTTGHTLEWLLIYLPYAELNQPWVTKGVDALLEGFERLKSESIECGALYYACHALRLYQQRRLSVAQQKK